MKQYHNICRSFYKWLNSFQTHFYHQVWRQTVALWTKCEHSTLLYTTVQPLQNLWVLKKTNPVYVYQSCPRTHKTADTMFRWCKTINLNRSQNLIEHWYSNNQWSWLREYSNFLEKTWNSYHHIWRSFVTKTIFVRQKLVSNHHSTKVHSILNFVLTENILKKI